MAENLYRIHPSDNVEVNAANGMKYATGDIPKGGKIVKYGFPIGAASRDIAKGEMVHTHNISSLLEGKGGYPPYRQYKTEEHSKSGTFLGYPRKNGAVGIRNDIFIIPTVGCVNGICDRLAAVTGAVALTHPLGCSQLGDDHEKTREILRGLALNPNAGGVLIVALGCENNTLDSFMQLLSQKGYDSDTVKFMTVQDEPDEIKTGLSIIAKLQKILAEDKRQPCPLSKLVIGLKCGGSDALSGITANPLVGRVSDRIVELGGSSVLTEIPEMFGAEDIMLSRSRDEDVYTKLTSAIEDFKEYYIAHGERIDENPSPGNKSGGISTLADKSLGCVQKGGTSAVVDVIDYGGFVTKSGLSVLNGPGNDIVACTALAAAGANLILFTTGRGTPLGGAVPVIKISTNTALYQNKPNWIDFDAGKLLDKSIDAQYTEDGLFDLVIATAEGKLTMSEQNGYREIAMWKKGVTL